MHTVSHKTQLIQVFKRFGKIIIDRLQSEDLLRHTLADYLPNFLPQKDGDNQGATL